MKKVFTVYINDPSSQKVKQLVEEQLNVITSGKGIVDAILKVYKKNMNKVIYENHPN